MSKIEFKKFLNLLAFIAVVAVAISLLIGTLFGGDVAHAFSIVAQCIAYFVTAVYAFYYVSSMRNTVVTIVYIVAVVAIIVLLIV